MKIYWSKTSEFILIWCKKKMWQKGLNIEWIAQFECISSGNMHFGLNISSSLPLIQHLFHFFPFSDHLKTNLRLWKIMACNLFPSFAVVLISFSRAGEPILHEQKWWIRLILMDSSLWFSLPCFNCFEKIVRCSRSRARLLKSFTKRMFIK